MAKDAWYMQIEGTEFGPAKLEQLIKLISASPASYPIYVWTEGMPNWTLAEDLPELSPHCAPSSLSPSSVLRILAKEQEKVIYRRESRGENRYKLVATVSIVHSFGRKSIIGVCQDISMHGMRVFAETCEQAFDAGEILQIEIHPITLTRMEPVTITVAVAWFHSDTREVGFRFRALDARGRQIIAEYQNLVNAQSWAA